MDHNSYDVGVSVGYKFNEKWTGTLGYMYTDVGMDPDDFGIIEQMSPPLDAHNVALGMNYRHNDRLTFRLGAMGNFYKSDTAQATYLAPGVVHAPKTEYKKENYTVACGVQYTFF